MGSGRAKKSTTAIRQVRRDTLSCEASLLKTAGQCTKQPVLRQFVVIESIPGRRRHPRIWIGGVNASQSGEPASKATRRIRRKMVAYAADRVSTIGGRPDDLRREIAIRSTSPLRIIELSQLPGCVDVLVAIVAASG